MGYRIELATDHADNAAAIAQLASQVEEDGLVLVSTEDVPEGSWVAFEITLEDGSVFLEGMGRCQTSEAADQGFQVLLGGLQLDTTGELLFERLQLARDDLESGGRPTGEVDLKQLEDEPKPESSMPPPTVGVEVGAKASWKPPPPAMVPPGKSVPPPAKKKESNWPWQPGKPRGKVAPPPKSTAPKPAKVPPKPPAIAKAPKAPTFPSTDAKPSRLSSFPAAASLPEDLQERLKKMVPLLVAEGRVRDAAEAHALALRVGLQALETVLEEDE
ncbi:MAG: hypothetical protein AAGE52_39565 [Myxococcota bacterium]